MGKKEGEKSRLLSVDTVEIPPLNIHQGNMHPGLFDTSSKPATKQAGSTWDIFQEALANIGRVYWNVQSNMVLKDQSLQTIKTCDISKGTIG